MEAELGGVSESTLISLSPSSLCPVRVCLLGEVKWERTSGRIFQYINHTIGIFLQNIPINKTSLEIKMIVRGVL